MRRLVLTANRCRRLMGQLFLLCLRRWCPGLRFAAKATRLVKVGLWKVDEVVALRLIIWDPKSIDKAYDELQVAYGLTEVLKGGPDSAEIM